VKGRVGKQESLGVYLEEGNLLRFSSISSVRVRGFVARKGQEENLVRGVWGFFFFRRRIL
jgi:hypothetical protein